MNRMNGKNAFVTSARRLLGTRMFAATTAFMLAASNATAQAGEHNATESHAAAANSTAAAHAPGGHESSAGVSTSGAAVGTHAPGVGHTADVRTEHATGEHGEAAGHDAPVMNWSDFSNTKQPPYLALLLNFAVQIGRAHV